MNPEGRLKQQKREVLRLSILCVGEMVADIVVRPVPAMDTLPDSVTVEQIDIVNGGDALNTAVGLGRMGCEVSFIGRAGNDEFGRKIIENARSAGVCMDHVRYSSRRASSKVIALIREDGARNFLHCPGSNEEFCLEDIPEAVLREHRHFHIGGTFHLPAFDGFGAAEALRRAKALGLTTSMDVAFDHSGRWLETIRCCMPFLDYFLPSLGEAECMLHTSAPREIAAALKELGAKNIILKMGEGGSYCSPETGGAFACGCYHVDTVDTTGAGDAFVGGFIGALDRGEPLRECVVWGTAAAAFTVRSVGASTGIPDYKTLLHFINSTERLAIEFE